MMDWCCSLPWPVAAGTAAVGGAVAAGTPAACTAGNAAPATAESALLAGNAETGTCHIITVNEVRQDYTLNI